MEVVTYRLTHTRVIVPDAPPIRTRKEWRRQQVLMKRVSKAIDETLARAIYGEQYGCQQPTSYPPKRERAPWPGVILNNAV